MPNKYSHSVVLAHYSSLGLIDLPNDEYIAYLKTYPSSRRISTTSGSQIYPTQARGSITPSTGHSGRYRISEDPASFSKSVEARREYNSSVQRSVIIESDEGSGDEHVVLHKKHEPVKLAPPAQKRNQNHELRTEKRRLPSTSTYTGRSSSEASQGDSLGDTKEQPFTQDKGGSRTSPPSVINLNDYESEHEEQLPPRFSSPRNNHIAAQAVSGNGRTISSLTRETRIYHPNPESEPDFDGFSDMHFSEVTITGLDSTDAKSSLAVPRSQFSKSLPAAQPVSHSSPRALAPLPTRVDFAADFNRNPSKQRQPRRNRSYDSISSIASDDMMHMTTALPPVLPHKPQKSLRTKPAKTDIASRDPRVNEDAIYPGFFDTLRSGPHSSSASPTQQGSPGLDSSSPISTSKPSQQYSRHSADHATPNPDFWCGLEEILSESDASAVFPPDIAKHKHRDIDATPTTRVDRPPRNGTEDGGLKRPTTAPTPKTTSRYAFASDKPLPHGRSKTTTTNNGSLDKPKVAPQLTTVQLVDTSEHKKGKRGFLGKLRKKAYTEKEP